MEIRQSIRFNLQLSTLKGIMGYPKTYYLYANVGALPDESLAAGIPLTVFSMFQLMFAIITPALIVGSLAERVDFHAW